MLRTIFSHGTFGALIYEIFSNSLTQKNYGQ